MKRIPGWAWVLLVGVVLLLPRLGSFGLWDPYEIKFADAARDIAMGKPAVPGGHLALQTLLAAVSVKILGTSELAGRLPSALCGVLGMLAVYYAASGLFSKRAALIAAIVVVVTPVYILESRSMASDVAAAGALALALGGLGRWVIEKKPIHLFAGIFGVAVAALGTGYLIGVVAPCVALLAAALLLAPEDKRDSVWRSLAGVGGAVLGAVVLGISLRWMLHGFLKEPVPGLLQHGAASLAQSFWGGIVHKGPAQFTFEEPVKLIGFGFFPASVVVPLAVGGFVTSAPADRRRAWARLFVLAFAATVFIGYELHCDRVSTELRFPGVGVLAVLVGAFAEDLLGEEGAHPLIAAALAIGVLLLVRDFALFPEDFAAAHIHESVRWPAEIKIGVPLALLALVIAGAGAAALARANLTWRKSVLTVALAGAVALAFYNAQIATPAFSDHVSFKSVFDHYRTLPKGPLRAYHVVGRGLDYYAGGKLEEIGAPDQLVGFLKGAGGGCAYAIIPNEELGGLDAQIRGAQVAYYVVDRSSSRFYLLSSCLPPGERDVNPLRNYVETQPPNPPPKRIVHANFEDKVELLGVDLPDHVSRLKDGKFTVTLYFHVLDKVPAGYKIFLHFDGCGNRFNGDHLPVDGRFGTQFWSKGDYITDRFVVPAPLMTTPSCRYEALMGFFLGDGRLKLTPGSTAEQNGTNRVPLGPIQVD